MLDSIRTSLRIKHNSLDKEIQKKINACLLDLQRVGVKPGPNPDELVESAVEMYCKWKFDYMGKGIEYGKNYRDLRDALSMSEKYQEGVDEE